MACLGFWSAAKVLPRVRKQLNASDTPRPAEVEMSALGDNRAGAAATGRGFKSHQPDVTISHPHSDETWRYLCWAAQSNRQAFGANASTPWPSKLLFRRCISLSQLLAR